MGAAIIARIKYLRKTQCGIFLLVKEAAICFTIQKCKLFLKMLMIISRISVPVPGLVCTYILVHGDGKYGNDIQQCWHCLRQKSSELFQSCRLLTHRRMVSVIVHLHSPACPTKAVTIPTLHTALWFYWDKVACFL